MTTNWFFLDNELNFRHFLRKRFWIWTWVCVWHECNAHTFPENTYSISIVIKHLSQGVYKFNWTNFQEIPGGISRKIQDMFALLRLCNVPNLLVCLNIEQKHDMHNMGAMAKIKRETSFLNKRSCTQFHHDWKPMQSIIDILHKNFQEDHTNSRGFPGGFLNSRRFPGFPGVVDTL